MSDNDQETPYQQPIADAAPSNSTEPPLSGRQKKLVWLYTGAAFLAGYIVSAGPAVFVARRMNIPMVGKIIEKLYLPLVLLVKREVPVIGPLIKAWVELFR